MLIVSCFHFIYEVHKPNYSDCDSDDRGNLSVNEHTWAPQTNIYDVAQLIHRSEHSELKPSTHEHSQTTKATLRSLGLMKTFGTGGKLWETRKKSWAGETMWRLEHVTFYHDIIPLFLDSAALFYCLTVHSNSNCDIYKIRWNPTQMSLRY